jgi:hypothetical protein
MDAPSIDPATPAPRPFAAELAVARDAAVGGSAAAPQRAVARAALGPALTTRVPVLPESADARPAGFPEREWRRAVRAHVVQEAVDVSLPASLCAIVTAWVVVYLAAIAGIPGAGWAAYVGGLLALSVTPWLVWRVAAGKPAVHIPRRATGEPAYAQLVANDAPRRWRRHAGEHGPPSTSEDGTAARHADVVQYATRAVRPPGGGVRLEVLAYEPIGRWAALADAGGDTAKGWQPDVSRHGDRFWRMRVVEHRTILDEDADALADGLAALEAAAADREAAARAARAEDHAQALADRDSARERAASEHGLVAGVNGWTRRRG